MGIWKDQKFDNTNWDDEGASEMEVRNNPDLTGMNTDAIKAAHKYFSRLIINIDDELTIRKRDAL